MAKKSKIEPISSRTFMVVICSWDPADTRAINEPASWFVRNRDTLADSSVSNNFEDYRRLKRVWRKSKEDFDSACRFMDFHTLFSAAGVSL